MNRRHFLKTTAGRLCELHEDLGSLQPDLEFMSESGEWVPSGLITGTLSEKLVGRYRIRKTP